MDYRPNVDAMTWFTSDVLPLVQNEIPDTRLYIVGQKPHARLEKLRHKNNVEITGWVQDVQPFLRGAGVYVAPLRMGSGTRLKILEAMASGCAVVATHVAISGMREEAKRAMHVYDDEVSMSKAIIELLKNPAQRATLGKTVQRFVRQHYDWPVLIPDLLNIYQGMGVG
jgi:glycosyltransferase involved in cell wall biosynthesis